MNSKNFIYKSSNYTYIIQGMITTSLGLLLPHMMVTYSLDYAQGGSMIFFLLIGGVISASYGGALINRTGEKLLVIFGALLIISGYGVVIFAQSVTLVYIMLFIVGTGTGFYNIALNTLIAKISESDPRKLSKLHMFFAVGALLATFIISGISSFNLSWKMFLYVMIAMNLVTVLLFIKTDTLSSGKKEEHHKMDLSFFRKPYIYIFTAMLFFYVGAETAVNGWVVTFINERKIIAASGSGYVLSVLWGIVILGRFLNQKISSAFSLEARLLLCSFLILFSYVFLINSGYAFGIILSVIILGLAMSAFFPNAVANASDRMKDNSVALGLLLSVGG